MVSVVMALYNGEKFIEKQLESIRLQTKQPDEVIICDDRSTDNSFLITKKYIENNNLNNWILIKNEVNKGYSRNFKDLMYKAKGDYIFLADQDDIWMPQKIERMLDSFSSNPRIDLLSCNVQPFYEGNSPRKVRFEHFISINRVIRIKSLYRWVRPARPGCAMAFKRNLLNEYMKIWNDDYPHDCLLWSISVLSGTCFIHNEALIRFRRHDNNTSSRSKITNDARIESVSEDYNRFKSLLKSNSNFLNETTRKKIQNQEKFFKKRINALRNRNILGILKLLPFIRFYGWSWYWLTDLFYCLR